MHTIAQPAQRLLRNFGWSVATEVANRGSLLVFSLVVARFLGVDDFALFSLSLVLAQYGWLVVDFGLSVAGTRLVAASGRVDRRIVSVLLTARLLLAGGVTLIALLGCYIAGASSLVTATVAASMLFVFGAALSPEWVLRGIHRFKSLSIANVVFVPLLAAIGVAGTLISHNLIFASLVRPASAIVVSLVLLREVRRLCPGVRLVWPDPADWRFFFAAAPLALSLALAGFTPYIGVPLLSILGSAADVGEFAAMLRIVMFFLGFNTLLATASLPIVSKAATVSMEAVRQLTFRLSAASFILGLVVASVLSVLAPWFVPPIFGDQYPRTLALIQLSSWVLPISFARVAFAVGLVAVTKQKQHLIGTAVGGAGALSVGVLLTWPLGPRGAALGLIFGEAATFAAMALLFGIRQSRDIASNEPFDYVAHPATVAGVASEKPA